MSSHTSLVAPPFHPAWYCPGRHLQSIWGYFLRARLRVVWRRERWDSPDGDFLGRRFPGCRRAGCSDAARAARTGRLFGLSLRARGRQPGRAPSAGGRWRSTTALAAASRTGIPSSTIAGRREIWASWPGGFSSVSVPARGSRASPWGETCCSNGLENAPMACPLAYAGPPRFPRAYSPPLRKGSRFRGGLFLQAASAGQREGKSGAFRRLAPRPHRHKRVRRARTFHHFDRLVIAPLYGFRDELDYYRQADASPYLPGVPGENAYPLAEDDPIVPPTFFPNEQVAESEC